ncbi:MAG: hypothetical protein ACRDID_21595, partial [Ktedonobacterales bacterium]
MDQRPPDFDPTASPADDPDARREQRLEALRSLGAQASDAPAPPSTRRPGAVPPPQGRQPPWRWVVPLVIALLLVALGGALFLRGRATP